MKKLIKVLIVLLVLTILSITGISIAALLKEPNHDILSVETVDTKIIPNKSSDIDEEKLEKEGLLEENPELSGAVREPKHNEEPLVSSSSNKVYYSQTDSRWKWHPYTSVGDSSQTIGTSGCGPTSAAMVVSSIKGVVYPDTMRRLVCK